MTAIWKAVALALAGLALTSCDPNATIAEAPQPQEISDNSIGHFCGMSLSEHPGPKGEIFVGGKKDPLWFSSVRETFAFTLLPEEPKNITAIYVTDMGKARNREKPEPGTWVDARKAFYVIGSHQLGGMGMAEAVPFGEEAQAKRFAAEAGGRVVAFTEVPEDYVLQGVAAEQGQSGFDHHETSKP